MFSAGRHRFLTALALGLWSLILAGCVALSTPTPTAVQPTATHVPDPVALARQLERADPIYRLWCKGCHGDVGQGLTDAFRMTWPEEDQNCWQSKCHSANHPPGGFIFPRSVPALAGPGALSKFRTAADIFGFIHVAMPFQEPGVLEDQDYWDLTAFVLRMNRLPLPDAEIGPDNAASINVGS